MTKKFSLRKHLSDQGVSTDEGFRFHAGFVLDSLRRNPRLDIRTYRVNPKNPNHEVYHG